MASTSRKRGTKTADQRFRLTCCLRFNFSLIVVALRPSIRGCAATQDEVANHRLSLVASFLTLDQDANFSPSRCLRPLR